MPASDGLLYKRYERIGLDELQWLQFQNDLVSRNVRRARMRSHGFVLYREPGGIPCDTWRATDDDNDGELTILLVAPNTDEPIFGLFIDKSGYAITLDQDQTEAITVPDDNTWYTLVCRRASSEYEPGTLQITSGSAAIVGTRTTFTRYSGKTSSGFDRGSLLNLLAGDSLNPGTYEIDTITDDLNLTLTASITGTNESGVPFGIAGEFALSPPVNTRIHQFGSVEFELVARTLTAADDDLIICDVKRDSSDTTQCQIIDRRQANLYVGVRSDRPRAVLIDIQHKGASGAPFSPSSPAIATVYGATEALRIHSAPCRFSQDLLLVIQDSTTQLVSRHLTPSGVGNTTTVIDNAGTATDPGVVRLPLSVYETTDTPAYPSHLCVYVKAQQLYYRTSVADGAAWSAETLIMDPTAIDPADTIEHPFPILLRSGRILVVLGYYDDSEGRTTIKYIYSDDYGVTWNTNTNAGFPAYTPGAGGSEARMPACRQLPDGRLFVVCQEGTTGGGGEYAVWWIGVSENSPVQSGSESFYEARHPDSSYVLLDPEIFPTPDDGIAIVATAYADPGALYVSTLIAGTLQEIGVSSPLFLNEGIVPYEQPLLITESPAPATPESLAIHLAFYRGNIWTLFKDSAGGSPDVIGARCLPHLIDLIRPDLQL